MIIMSTCLTILAVPAAASDVWHIMKRGKKCTSIALLARDNPLLRAVKTPQDYIKTLENNGIDPIVDTKLASQGYVNISKAYGEISLTFSKADNCKKIVKEHR